MFKRYIYRWYMQSRVSQATRDEDEFLSDLDMMRSKWALRGQKEYANGIKAVIAGFADPERSPDFDSEVERTNKNILT